MEMANFCIPINFVLIFSTMCLLLFDCIIRSFDIWKKETFGLYDHSKHNAYVYLRLQKRGGSEIGNNMGDLKKRERYTRRVQKMTTTHTHFCSQVFCFTINLK